MPTVKVKLAGPALKLFKKGRAQSAVRRSSRKAASTSARDMRAEAVKVVRESKRLKARAVRKAIVQRKNKGRKVKDMEWGVDVRGGLVRLSDYPVRQTKKGVSVEINRGKRSLLRGRFIATVGKGDKRHKGVFVRKGDVRLPIEEQLGTRPIGVLRERRAAKAVTTRGRKSFHKTYHRWLGIEMEKAAR